MFFVLKDGLHIWNKEPEKVKKDQHLNYAINID